MSEKGKLEEDYGMESFFSEEISETIADEIESSGQIDPNMYATSLNNDKVVGGVYKSRVRFMKNPRNTKEKVLNVLFKYMYFLPHPDNPKGRLVVDCTSNFGQQYNIVSTAFFYLRETKNPAMMALAKENFSRKGYYFSLLKIVSDVQQPDMVNQIKVYRFAKQVNDKLEDVTKGDETVGTVGVNYSHPFTGTDFIIDVREEEFTDEKTGKTRTMTSYSKSKFVSEASIVAIPDYDVKNIKATQEYAKDLYTWTLENSPVLEDYSAKKWSDEDEEMIIRAVRMAIDDDNIFANIYKKQYKKPFVFGKDDSITGKGLQIEESSMLAETEVEEEKADDAGMTETKEEANTNAEATQSEEADEPIASKKDDLPDDEEFN